MLFTCIIDLPAQAVFVVYSAAICCASDAYYFYTVLAPLADIKPQYLARMLVWCRMTYTFCYLVAMIPMQLSVYSALDDKPKRD